MTDILESDQLRRGPVRWLVWGGAAALLLLPLVAMQFTAEVNWDGFDFLVMGGMLLTACVLYEVAACLARSNAYMVAAGIAVGGAFLTVWANGAVGIIGNEDNPANLMFFGVIAVAIAGSFMARFKAPGMAVTMAVTALGQFAVPLIAMAIWSPPLDADLARTLLFNSAFAGLWLLSAWLFRQAPSPE